MEEAQKPKILVVDDTEGNRYLAARFLSQAGFEVWQATSGEEGLRAAQAGPDLIILDVRLPDRSGLEICRQLKAHPSTKHIPVLQISAAFKSARDKVQGLESGADGYLSGPVEPEELVANTKLLLRLHEASESLRKTNERLYAILDNTRAVVYMVDATGRFLLVNQRFEELFGLENTSVAGKTLWEVFPQQLADIFALNNQQVLAEGKALEFEESVPQAQGLRTYISVKVPLLDANGAPYAICGISTDITERKRSEQELRNLTCELQKAQEKLQEHAAELEAKVQQRTAELAGANEKLRLEISERQRAEQSRDALLRQLVNAQEEERRRLSRELHDHMGQHLTALGLGLKAVRDRAPRDCPSQELLPRLEALVSEVGKAMHQLAFQLRPTALDDVGLLVTLRNYVREWSEHYQIEADFQSHGYMGDSVSGEVDTTIYRVVQEALTNVVKHARSTRVSVILERTSDQVQVIIEDNGCGFEPDTLASPENLGKRLGLLGMKERMTLAGGTLTIESSAGGGTTVFGRIPL
jgi:PAS domain S-box-containing protein